MIRLCGYLVWLALAVSSLACGGGGTEDTGQSADVAGGGGDVISGSDADTQLASQDALAGTGDATPSTQADTDATTGTSTTDAGPTGDVPGTTDPGQSACTGTGAQPVGAACATDEDCADCLCLVTQLGGACTVPCSDQATCSDAFGLDCVEVRPGEGGCMPQLAQFPDACSTHMDCPFPLRCRSDTGYCSVGECLWDADCPAGELCDVDARACTPTTCGFDEQCPFPGERCVDAMCGPPQCTSAADCPTEGDYCHPIQRSCATPSTCTPGDEEDGCFYHETCEAGLCLPNPCWNGCPNPADQCDDSTGHCGAPCSGTSGCAAGQGCHSVMGLCYDNTPPVAAGRVLASDGTWASGASVAVGAAASLSAAASADGEGEPLSHAWTLALHPPDSAQTAGEVVGATETVTFTPDVEGLYLVTLVVTDAGGLAGITDQVLLWAW